MKTLGITLAGLALLACASGSGATAGGGSSQEQSPDQGQSSMGGLVGGTATGGSTAINIDGRTPISLPPEVESATAFQTPVVTGDYLWSANTESGKVALIDARTLNTRVLSAGLQPTYLAAVPGEQREAAAIVMNVGTSDASFFELTDEGVRTRRVSVHVGANAWEIAGSGRWAVAWSRAEAGLDPTNGLQEISLIDLAADELETRRITVGYRPGQVVFDQAEEELIVVSEQGISLVSLSTFDVRWVALSQGQGRDVSVTSDGDYALVRRPDSAEIELVALDGESSNVELLLDGSVTDLDLAPSGRAVAVVREESQLVTFDVDEVLASTDAVDTVVIAGELVGSAELTKSGHRAVLYTNAVSSSRATLVDLELGDSFLNYRTLDTQTPVQSLVVSPDGAHALVLGQGTEGALSGAFSILALSEERFPRVIGTTAPILQMQLGDRVGVVTASTQGRHEAHLISLEGLHVERLDLASPPMSAGILAELELGFAAQEHPEGRVTFFEFGAEAQARTLTGFELSSEIVEE